MAAFPDVQPIKYEGPDSKNPLAFRHYNPDEVVEGKSMKDHLRFAVSYWHTFRGMGGDPFGPGCAVRPWEDGSDTHKMDLARVDVAFLPRSAFVEQRTQGPWQMAATTLPASAIEATRPTISLLRRM